MNNHNPAALAPLSIWSPLGHRPFRGLWVAGSLFFVGNAMQNMAASWLMIELTAEMARIVKLPDVVSKLLELGFEPVGWGPEKLSSFLAEQLALTQKLVATGRIKL